MTPNSGVDRLAPFSAGPADQQVERSHISLKFITALANSAAVAMYHADNRGQITYANAKYRQLFEMQTDDNFDNWAQGVHPQDRRRMQESWRDFCQNPRPAQFQWRSQSSQGVIRFLTETVVPVITENVQGFVGTITDVTELKETQAELENLHQQLVQASRQAGRAEIATNVLHNVGNVLNSVNVSANLVTEYVKNSKVNTLSKIVTLLEEQQADLAKFFTEDERGKRLPGYLAKLSAQIETYQERSLAELHILKKNIEHIKHIVSMQQNYAKIGEVSEPTDITELVEDSLKLNESALERLGIFLQRDFQTVPSLVVDRHKVLQILVNLMQNARHACEDSGRVQKLITMQIAPSTRGLQITVTDNGVGIPSEHMTSIFHHGFTTKKDGHGFGLHSGALSAKELGGELTAHSNGLDCGATFVLDLPLTPPVKNHA